MAPEEIGGRQREFMDWWVQDVHDAAEQTWAVDIGRAYIAGSSFGGVFALTMGVEREGVYAGAASLSGSFWAGEEEGASLYDRVRAAGKRPLSLYLDHGGSAAQGGDNYADNLRMLEVLGGAQGLGWRTARWPACAAPGGGDDLCHWHQEGATHDELAWRDRSPALLRVFFGADG